MARKVKIPNEVKKRHSRSNILRPEGIKHKRRFYLIVCEGEKTEPNYFRSLKEALPKGVVEVCDFEIIGTGHNTKSLVTKAMAIRTELEGQRNRPIDKLWVVFDRDSFTRQSFNAAIGTCTVNRPKVDCAWTNEAFELWYLLHFHFYNTAISRDQYQKLIEKNFQANGLIGYKYTKNSTEMFALLEKYGDRGGAISFADKLGAMYAGQSHYSEQNPCTMVHKLVEELFGLEKTVLAEGNDNIS